MTALAGHDVVSVVKRGIYFWLALPLLTVFVMFVLVFGALFMGARRLASAEKHVKRKSIWTASLVVLPILTAIVVAAIVIGAILGAIEDLRDV